MISKIYFYIRKGSRMLIGFWLYLLYRKKVEGHANKKGKIFIDLKENSYHRYLYLLVKFFQINGYQVILRANPYFMWGLTEDKFAKLILEEEQVDFSIRKPKRFDLFIGDSTAPIVMSVDYFTNLICSNQKIIDEYYIPMAMHPIMYQEGLWNAEVKVCSRRQNNVFFAGSFDEDGSQTFFSGYQALKQDGIFKVLDRITIYKLLTEQNAFFPRSYEDLSNFQEEKQVIIVDTKNFFIPAQDLRRLLAHYNFFLACPGVIMPLSHNIIEAMSVGTIPIIEREYAEIFVPSLESGKNAIIFEGEESLKEQINNVFLLGDEQISKMIGNVLNYYKEHLTPHKVIEKIVEGKFSRIYLQGEHHSVYWLKKSIAKENNFNGIHN